MNDSARRDVPMTSPVTEGALPTITGSFALAHGPLARALHEYACVTGNRGIDRLNLTAQNAAQAEVVDWILSHLSEIPQLRDLESLASSDYEVLNSFLVARGFAPLFTPFPSSDLGITSVIDATMLWKAPGTATTIARHDGMYPAFKLTSQTAGLHSLRYAEPFDVRVVLDTQSGHQLYLAMLPEDHPAPENGAELLRLARLMLGARTYREDASGGIIVPKVNFDKVSELPWFNGLQIEAPDGSSYPLTQCRQHAKLYMNELGARMAAAFAGVVSREPSYPYTIDRHFVLAVVDGTTSTAVFYLRPDDSWSEPPAGAIVAP
jgi:hypothetical protein